jgi:Arc/MetJ family transcription regulator
MPTKVEIDDALIAEAQKASDCANKKETVEQALRLMIRRAGSRRSTLRLANTVGAAISLKAVAGGEPGDRCEQQRATASACTLDRA